MSCLLKAKFHYAIQVADLRVHIAGRSKAGRKPAANRLRPRQLNGICLYCLLTYLQGANVWHMLSRDHTFLPANHTINLRLIPAFTSQPQSITASCLILIFIPLKVKG